ncbi:transporter substrate-binding domain-containing protein [Anaerosinus massiliensis]|uniref:transporter substrate-binding domain-containing protein n=1 Tax=Massilibacillus massiliensis TaxID=1806837 RepID=UPI000B215F9D|nr:transporter substrate-binding domain-containing protein [Massilibacillus massiliensis]
MNLLTKGKKYGSFGLVFLFIMGLMLTTGCGLNENNKQAATKSDKEVKTYTVATRGTFRPFTYMDEKDQLTGYDIEILREVEKRNPDIKFEFKTMSVDAGFLGLESGQVDIIANQIVENPKRADKSIFTKEVNNYTSRKLAVKGDRDDIKSIDDLRGKKVAVTSSSEVTRQLQKYNETADPKIELVYTDKGSTETLNLVATGRVDASPTYEVVIVEAKNTLGLDVKPVGPTIASDATCYALRKDEKSQELANRIDATIKEMRADGTLKKLSEKFLGKDYTVPQK